MDRATPEAPTCEVNGSFNGLLKVYVREPGDLDIIAACVGEQMGSRTPVIYLQGDVCRQDLLTEVEGINF